jgi:hypothetical protein
MEFLISIALLKECGKPFTLDIEVPSSKRTK